MKNLILTIAIAILMLSCGGNSSTAPTPGADPIKESILKINTSIYNKFDETAEKLLSISVSNSSGGYTTRPMETLDKGIKIPTGTTIYVKVQSPTGGDYENNILWTGYAFRDATLARDKAVEIVMYKDIYLTLVTTESPQDTIDIATLFLTVNAPDTFTGVGVKANNVLYNNGAHEIQFANGQNVAFEAITTTNKSVRFLGFQTVNGNVTDINTTNAINGDTVVQADFVDKNLAIINVTITGIHPTKSGIIYVNGKAIEQASGSDDIPIDHPLLGLSVGQKIVLKAEPAGSKKFVSWNDNLVGFLNDKAEGYEYVVSADAVITPVFSEATGVVTVSISPRTNYFTKENSDPAKQHRQNMVKYIVYNKDGAKRFESSDGGSSKHLTWENNTITGIEAKDRIELIAEPGLGFFDGSGAASGNIKDSSKVKWTGAATGTGFEKNVVIGDDGASIGVNVGFTIEQRTVTVKLETKKQISSASDSWNNEDPEEDAKGYTIYINDSPFKDTKTASKIFDWHTKVNIKVDGGIHYEATNSIKQISVPKNPEESYNITNPTNALSFDLETNNIVTAEINHKQVTMNLNIVGGKFDNSSTSDKTGINTNYNGFVAVKGTGYDDMDLRYYPEYYYDGNTTANGSSIDAKLHSILVLSGVPVIIDANPNSATLFKSHAAFPTLIPTGATTNTNVMITNTGATFIVTSRFYAPIWTLTVNMKGNVLNGSTLIPESIDYKAGDYNYEIKPHGDTSGKKIVEVNKQFKVTNGLPVNIAAYADPTGHYTFHSIAGDQKGNKDISITNNSTVQIDFIHNQRKITLNITGGKDDRSTSYVEVSGSGISGNDGKYYAQHRNVDADGINITPYKYEVNVLSGLNNKVKLNAVTSSVHNFDKMTGNGITVSPVGTIKDGFDSYSQTNSYTLATIPASGGSIDAEFRINSYLGLLNGSSDNKFKRESADAIVTAPDGIPTYLVYTASQLKRLAEKNSPFDGERIKLMNDIYFGKSTDFKGFVNKFQGSFAGNNFIVFDINIQQRGFFTHVNNGQIVALVTGRGAISGKDEADQDMVGLIAQVTGATIVNSVTNSSAIGTDTANKNDYGGVIGRSEGDITVSTAANYGSVTGNQHVGGVIGRSTGGAKNIKFIYNRGRVKGDRQVGGVVGRMSVGDNFNYLYNSGEVKGGSFVGGIVGLMGWARNGNSGDLKIVNFYNTGDIIGGSGIAGTILGCREIMDGGIGDNTMGTEALINGYSIGKYDIENGASLITEAGHRADHGGHYVYAINTYAYNTTEVIKNPLKSGLYKRTDIDGRMDGKEARTDYVKFIRRIIKDGKEEASEFSGASSDNAPELKRILVNQSGASGFNVLSTSLEAFNNREIWVQTSGLSNINGFTSRPTLTYLPERNLESYMLQY